MKKNNPSKHNPNIPTFLLLARPLSHTKHQKQETAQGLKSLPLKLEKLSREPPTLLKPTNVPSSVRSGQSGVDTGGWIPGA